MDEMTKDERSLLLYLESRAVDNAGRVDTLRMNHDDNKILERWTSTGFVESGRICFADVRGSQTRQESAWVKLSDEAFRLAHAERKARALRLWEARSYKTTADKRAGPVG